MGNQNPLGLGDLLKLSTLDPFKVAADLAVNAPGYLANTVYKPVKEAVENFGPLFGGEAGVQGPIEKIAAETAPKWYSPLADLVNSKLAKREAGLPERSFLNPKTGVKETVPAKPGETFHPKNITQQAIGEAAKETRVTGDVLRDTGIKEIGSGSRADVVQAIEDRMPKLQDYAMSDNWQSVRGEYDSPKFADYQEPGPSTNYKELFVTAPETSSSVDWEKLPFKSFSEWLGKEHRLNTQQYLSLSAQERKFVDNEWRTLTGKSYWNDGHEAYSDVQNPIVRLRMNDRVAADGKRTLFLEEIQPPQKEEFDKMPEWAQKNWMDIGLKRALKYAADNGYDQVAWTPGELQAERYNLSKKVSKIEYNPGLSTLSAYNREGRLVFDEMVEPGEINKYVGDEIAAKLNREIGNYSPLSVDDFSVESSEGGKGYNVYDANGEILHDSGGDELHFPTIRDAYREIADMVEDDYNQQPLPHVSGNELDIGGKGLKRAYDETAPAKMNDIARKLGGGNVGTAELNLGEDINKAKYVGPTNFTSDDLYTIFHHRSKEIGATLGNQLTMVAKKVKEGSSFTDAIEEYGSHGLAHFLGGKFEIPKKVGAVHAIQITPAMRNHLTKKGAPLFAIGAGAGLAASSKIQDEK